MAKVTKKQKEARAKVDSGSTYTLSRSFSFNKRSKQSKL